MQLSIIVTTYNWPQALKKVLLALDFQCSYPFEVIVADDGSTCETCDLITSLQNKVHYELKHVRQEDCGFRAGMIRNKAIAAAQGDYMVFIDHDCIPCKSFVKKHIQFSEEAYFVSASRFLVDKCLTAKILNTELDLPLCSFSWFAKQFNEKHINRILPLLPVKLGPLRYLKKSQWKGTANLIGVWKKDLIAVNGYDENFHGWGYEDSDLVVRLIQSGVKRKSARFGTEVFHLNHPKNDRQQHDENWQRLQARVSGQYRECVGLNQYL